MFSAIEAKPKISVTFKDDVGKVRSLVEVSERNCFISNSLRSKVVLKPKIRVNSQKTS